MINVLFSHWHLALANFAFAVEQRCNCGQTYQDVDKHLEPCPTTKNGVDEVELKRADQTPVQTTGK
ncbi:MAG: hypothetical protein A3J66_01475 [Candidatus Magasanikbacteria bacterium RIFCSPHIGHO2_02_FULL_47_14]|uniref:Uncharacterized protein n=1 Tax=Candidatus Magasanikbacteria bacterium RIFCSPHIGHO2_02_FULL_47_14 TaxID=1798680 RepID=A0A1F6MB85_9BACT|nr:MAG: hypothetical protein A3J66_01475 [Candidatus Magasanikbacteria bacterium RIFCSPHIGHO2_02_FULL_47_14]